jgi:hypothetical protein
MYLHREETIKKVLVWKACSISLTMATLWMFLGSATDAALLSLILHGVFIASHRLFEIFWEKRSDRY